MVPRTILTRSGPILLNTARPVDTVQPRTAVDNARPMKNDINNAYSTARRPFNKITPANNSNVTKKVSTVKGTRVNTAKPKAVLSVVKENKGNVVKASACWQFEIKLVNVQGAKKLEKSHDPLALVAHTDSSSRNTSSYYVTHPTSVVDYEDEYQQDDVHTNFEDPLASAMLLLIRAIPQNFYTQQIIVLALHPIPETSNNFKETGGEYFSSRNSWNYPQSQVIRDSKYFMEQMLLAKQEEARVILNDEQNDFLFADASRDGKKLKR
ncbi:hypothetical protein Tco_1464942 [Tanacetum coccineum]